MKLLLAEDTRDLNRAVTTVLEHSGYQVDSAYDGAQALEFVQNHAYDAVVMDIMMPKMSGIDVLKKMRAGNDLTPVLLLTAKAEVDDRVDGLDAGADDYLTKPFAMKELLARIRSLTRRQEDYSGRELKYADLELNADNYELIAHSSIRLSNKEFELMQTLMLNPDRELETQYLLEHVWKNEADAEADTVWLYVSYLKGKLRSVNTDVTIEGEKGGSFKLTEKK